MIGSGPSQQAEYPPLLDCGLHRLSTCELRKLCVVPFSLSVRRGTLMTTLESIVARFQTAGVSGELWVDGSFMTRKIDPKDVDVVLAVPYAIADNPDAGQQAAIEWYMDDPQLATDCHTFVFVDYPQGHPNELLGPAMRRYWTRQFGYSRSNQRRGIAVIELP